MATIRLTCPTGCGDVEVNARSTRTHTYTVTGTHALTYRCPRCERAAARPIEDRVLDLCAAAGVPHRTLEAPGELGDDDRNVDRPAPTTGELDAAVAALEAIDDLEALLAACG